MRRYERNFFAWVMLIIPSSVLSDGNLAQYPPIPKDIFARTAEDGAQKLELLKSAANR